VKKRTLFQRLSEIVGSEHVSDQDFARLASSVESTATGLRFLSPFSETFKLPKVVVKPQTTAQVVDILKLANETRTPVVVKGGGSGASLGTVSTKESILVDMTDMEQIIEIDEASMAVTVQAGVTWGKLRHELNRHDLRPGPLGPHGTWGATIGGGLSYDSCCVDSHRYGQLSEEVLNLKVVLPTGEVIETGSRVNQHSPIHHRYCNGPDLAGLFLGASGSLGIITEATIRVHVKEPCMLHQTFGFRRLDEACTVLHELSIRGYIDDFWLLCGKHSVQVGYPEQLEGIEAVLALYTAVSDQKTLDARKQKWHDATRGSNAIELDADFADKFASDYRGFETAEGQSMSWVVISIWPILKIPEFYPLAENALRKHEKIFMGKPGKKQWSVSACGGARSPMTDFTIGFMADRSQSDVRLGAFEALKEIQCLAVGHGAALYDLGRLPSVNYLWENGKSAFEFLKILKKAVDPNDIMNPGSLMI